VRPAIVEDELHLARLQTRGRSPTAVAGAG